MDLQKNVESGQGYRLPLFGRTTTRPAYALAGWELSGVNREAGRCCCGCSRRDCQLRRLARASPR